MYSFKGVPSNEWNICDWCVTNGCADYYIDKVEEFVDPNHRKFSCNCRNVHATINIYMCDDCTENPHVLNSTGAGNCLRCKSEIDCGKYCASCAHSELKCICGNPHRLASIGLVDLLYISQYFHVDCRDAYGGRKYKVISREARITYPSKVTFSRFVARKKENKAILNIIAEMAKNNTENDSCKLSFDDSSDSESSDSDSDSGKKPWSQLKLMEVPFSDSGRIACIIAKMCAKNITYINLLNEFTEQEVLAADSSICDALDNDDIVEHIYWGVFSGNLTCSALKKYLSRLHDLNLPEKFYTAIRMLLRNKKSKYAKKMMPQMRPLFAAEVVSECCTDGNKKLIKSMYGVLGVENMKEVLNIALGNSKTSTRSINNIVQMIPGFKWTIEHIYQSIDAENSCVFALASMSVNINPHRRILFERIIAKRGQNSDENNALRTIAKTLIQPSLDKFLAGVMDDDFTYFVAGYGKMFGNNLYELVASFANCKITYESALELIKLGYVPKDETINRLSDQFRRSWSNNSVNWNVVQMLRATRTAFKCKLYDEWDDLFEKRLEQFLETHDICSRGTAEKLRYYGGVLDKVAQPISSPSTMPYIITKWDICFYDEEYLYIANKLRMFVKHYYGIRNPSSSSEDETTSSGDETSSSDAETSTSSSSSSSAPMKQRRDSTSSSDW